MPPHTLGCVLGRHFRMLFPAGALALNPKQKKSIVQEIEDRGWISEMALWTKWLHTGYLSSKGVDLAWLIKTRLQPKADIVNLKLTPPEPYTLVLQPSR